MAFLGQRFAELQMIAEERPQNSIPKIQRVPKNVLDRKDFAKYYSPKLMSFGPIHHGDANLKSGEEYKPLWAAKYIKSTKQTPPILHKKIEDNIEELEMQFEKDVLTHAYKKWRDDWEGFTTKWERLSWVLFVDGCALLQIMMKGNLDHLYEMGVNFDIMSLAKQDALLLENQVPYVVLKLLWTDNEFALLQTMRNICIPYQSTDNYHMNEEFNHIVLCVDELPPVHLLDFQRKILLASYRHPKNKQRGSADIDMVTYMNVEELRATGIRLKSSKTCSVRDIDFSHGWLAGELLLPVIIVDDTTSVVFLNLMAYEMCPDFKNYYEIRTFVAFIDSLIRQPEDVKALRSAGILLSSYGSDMEVARQFNFIATDVEPNLDMYAGVRAQINKHIGNNLKINMVRFLKHIRHPWAKIAIHTAELALALTFIQTWFTIHPAKSN